MMNKEKMKQLEAGKLYLHDEGVTGLSWKDNILNLDLEYYDDERHAFVPYSIIFHGVDAVNDDHAPVKELVQPTDSGDALNYKEADGKASLLIEWHNFKNKQRITKLYEFDFDHWQVKNS